MTNSKKINLGAFSDAELLAKLLVFQLNFENKKDELINSKLKLIRYCYKLTNNNFIDNGDVDFNAKHLALFLLGNKNNCFDYFLNRINIDKYYK